jgi:Raf kinase inhibitor-like YbhB/YbcL family protein
MLAVGVAATSQGPTSLAREALAAGGAGQLAVTSSAFQSGQPIPLPYSQDGENFSPAISWTGMPANTRTFAVLVEDPDAKEPKPYLHWSIYNLPASVTSLHESIPTHPQLPDLSNARQGRTSRGTIGYVGPRPPVGDPPHHYHFQVFALDIALGLPPGAERVALLDAMKGHVLASGEVVGTFRRP